MMKAKRSYKQDVQEKKKDLEQALIEGFKKDMAKPSKRKPEESESQVWLDQMSEFETFLEDAVKKNKPFPFLVDMHKKLVVDGENLTDNMVSAVRKCKAREDGWKEQRKASEAGEYPSITLKVRPFLMKELKLDSRIITGKVKAESAKAWLIEGHADLLENMSWCVRCGRELKEPASQVTGMGQICAVKAGVPYDPTDVLGASKKERTKIRKQFKEKLLNQKFERWIPKSMAEVFEHSDKK